MRRPGAAGHGRPDHKDGVDITGDGGVRKLTLKNGNGQFIPKTGVTAVVHYTGRLADGQEFDSSVKRGKPFKFDIGKRDVILGWDHGVATMCKGEVSMFTIQPDYGYGRTGVGPIPPNAELRFEIELIDWETNEGKLEFYVNVAIYVLSAVVLCMAVYIYGRREKFW